MFTDSTTTSIEPTKATYDLVEEYATSLHNSATWFEIRTTGQGQNPNKTAMEVDKKKQDAKGETFESIFDNAVLSATVGMLSEVYYNYIFCYLSTHMSVTTMNPLVDGSFYGDEDIMTPFHNSVQMMKINSEGGEDALFSRYNTAYLRDKLRTEIIMEKSFGITYMKNKNARQELKAGFVWLELGMPIIALCLEGRTLNLDIRTRYLGAYKHYLGIIGQKASFIKATKTVCIDHGLLVPLDDINIFTMGRGLLLNVLLYLCLGAVKQPYFLPDYLVANILWEAFRPWFLHTTWHVTKYHVLTDLCLRTSEVRKSMDEECSYHSERPDCYKWKLMNKFAAKRKRDAFRNGEVVLRKVLAMDCDERDVLTARLNDPERNFVLNKTKTGPQDYNIDSDGRYRTFWGRDMDKLFKKWTSRKSVTFISDNDDDKSDNISMSVGSYHHKVKHKRLNLTRNSRVPNNTLGSYYHSSDGSTAEKEMFDKHCVRPDIYFYPPEIFLYRILNSERLFFWSRLEVQIPMTTFIPLEFVAFANMEKIKQNCSTGSIKLKGDNLARVNRAFPFCFNWDSYNRKNSDINHNKAAIHAFEHVSSALYQSIRNYNNSACMGDSIRDAHQIWLSHFRELCLYMENSVDLVVTPNNIVAYNKDSRYLLMRPLDISSFPVCPDATHTYGTNQIVFHPIRNVVINPPVYARQDLGKKSLSCQVQKNFWWASDHVTTNHSQPFMRAVRRPHVKHKIGEYEHNSFSRKADVNDVGFVPDSAFTIHNVQYSKSWNENQPKKIECYQRGNNVFTMLSVDVSCQGRIQAVPHENFKESYWQQGGSVAANGYIHNRTMAKMEMMKHGIKTDIMTEDLNGMIADITGALAMRSTYPNPPTSGFGPMQQFLKESDPLSTIFWEREIYEWNHKDDHKLTNWRTEPRNLYFDNVFLDNTVRVDYDNKAKRYILKRKNIKQMARVSGDMWSNGQGNMSFYLPSIPAQPVAQRFGRSIIPVHYSMFPYNYEAVNTYGKRIEYYGLRDDNHWTKTKSVYCLEDINLGVFLKNYIANPFKEETDYHYEIAAVNRTMYLLSFDKVSPEPFVKWHDVVYSTSHPHFTNTLRWLSQDKSLYPRCDEIIPFRDHYQTLFNATNMANPSNPRIRQLKREWEFFQMYHNASMIPASLSEYYAFFANGDFDTSKSIEETTNEQYLGFEGNFNLTHRALYMEFIHRKFSLKAYDIVRPEI